MLNMGFQNKAQYWVKQRKWVSCPNATGTLLICEELSAYTFTFVKY